MVKVLDKERKHYTNYNFGPLEQALDLSKLTIDIDQIEF